MTREYLDITPLRQAVATLERALTAYAADDGNEFIRDACIQRFEYCYDLAAKMIKRHLKMTEADPSAVEAMTFQERVRRAYAVGLIPNSWDKWWEYRDDRAATSHGYNAQRALAIVVKLPVFYQEVSALLVNLARHHDPVFHDSASHDSNPTVSD